MGCDELALAFVVCCYGLFWRGIPTYLCMSQFVLTFDLMNEIMHSIFTILPLGPDSVPWVSG
jgi:hypothetical protein